MAPKLYYMDSSPPVRSVLLTAKALGLKLELIPVNLMAGEHLKPEYLKMNPQHTVPTLDDNGYYLWDSHAINAYLVGKYGKDDSLYPKDLQKKGIVDQRLHFNSGVVQPSMGAIIRPIIREGATSIPKEKAAGVHQVYDFLETFLDGHKYIAGDNLTIADFSLGAALSSILPFVPFLDKHVQLTAWFERIKALPYYKEANQEGVNKLVEFIKSKLA